MVTGLQPIYERLNGAKTYHPYNAKTFADWSLEAGDEVSVSRDGVVYTSPVHVSTMTWKGSQDIVLESNGEKERDAIAKVSAQKFAKGGGFRNARSQYAENIYLEWNQGYLYSRLEITAEYLRSTFEDRASYLYSRLEQTASYLRSTFEDRANYLYSRVEQTASYWRSTLEDRTSYLYSRVEQTASHWMVELANTYGKLTTSIEATASGLRVETENRQRQDAVLAGRLDVSDTKVDLLVTVEDDRPVLWYSSRQSADWPEGRGSTKYLYYAADEKAYYEWKDGQFVKKKAGSMSPLVNAGGIVSAINKDKTISTRIYGDHIYIGNDSAETYIGGTLRAAKAYADTLTAGIVKTSTLKAEIGNLELVNVQSITGSKTDSDATFNGYYGNHFYLNIPGGGGSVSYRDIKDGIYEISLESSGNSYTLKAKNYAGTETEIGTFSRATTLKGDGWSGGVFTVKASPQGNKYKIGFGNVAVDEQLSIIPVDAPEATSYPQVIKVPISVTEPSDEGYATVYTTKVSINASMAYENGWNLARGKVSIPGYSVSGSITPQWPSSTVGEQESRTYELYSATNNTVILRYNQNGAGEAPRYVTAALLTHNQYRDGYNAGVIDGKKVTIDLKDPVFATSPPSHVKNPKSLDTISNLIRNNSHGYVYFNVTAGSENKWYYITTPT